MQLNSAWIVRWVAENRRLYEMVKDRGFVMLMKTGGPGRETGIQNPISCNSPPGCPACVCKVPGTYCVHASRE